MPKPRRNHSRNGRIGKPRHGAKVAGPSRRSRTRDPEDGVIRALAESGRLGEGARAEVEAQRAAGLPITYQRGNEVIKEYPDGRYEVLETLPPTPVFKVPKGVRIIRNGFGTNGRG